MSWTSKAARVIWDVAVKHQGLAPPEHQLASIIAAHAESRIRELEALVYIGDHHFPDLTWKSRASELSDALHASERRIESLIALLRESKREHSDGEDMICATDYAAPNRGPCDCGADDWNDRVDALTII